MKKNTTILGFIILPILAIAQITSIDSCLRSNIGTDLTKECASFFKGEKSFAIENELSEFWYENALKMDIDELLISADLKNIYYLAVSGNKKYEEKLISILDYQYKKLDSLVGNEKLFQTLDFISLIRDRACLLPSRSVFDKFSGLLKKFHTEEFANDYGITQPNKLFYTYCIHPHVNERIQLDLFQYFMNKYDNPLIIDSIQTRLKQDSTIWKTYYID